MTIEVGVRCEVLRSLIMNAWPPAVVTVDVWLVVRGHGIKG